MQQLTYGEALAACQEFAAATGALASHAYDHPLIAAGATAQCGIARACGVCRARADPPYG